MSSTMKKAISAIERAAALILAVMITAGVPQMAAHAQEAGNAGAVTEATEAIDDTSAEAVAAGEAAAQQTLTGTVNNQVAIEEQTQPAASDDLTVLAGIIYCEAGSESYQGKVAVGSVVMNRIASSRYPDTIREVVYQSGQFTPALNGRLDRAIANGSIPADCYQAAQEALGGSKPVGACTCFNGNLAKSDGVIIGGHRFYGSL